MAKKNIGRIRDAEIKKQLRNFAKKEYNEKKPLEIRVLQLKPGVVFKKGSILPSLVIKKLAGTAYVVHLDYGDQLKFYYFAKNGTSLGSSNFDKSEKLLKEMHGKATTLLKLPKIVHIVGLEAENKKIKDIWERLASQYSHKLGIPIKKLLAISIKKNLPKNSLRIGIKQDKDILHFDYDYFNTDLQDIILLRELFSIFTNTRANKETIQMISTIWALTLSDSKNYIQILKTISLNKGVNKKAFQWIQANFLPFIKSDKELEGGFAKFLFLTCKIINQKDIIPSHEFFELFLLWLMKYGIKRFTLFFDYSSQIFRNSWIYFEMLELYYDESTLCRNYGINQNNDQSLPLIHLCSRFVLEKDSKVDKGFLIGIDPNYLQMETALRNLHLFEFTKLIPEPLFIKNKDFLQDVLFYLLSSKGIIVEHEPKIDIPQNSEKTLEMMIKNKTDWILKDVKFHVNVKPQNRIILQKIDPPKLPQFAGDLKVKLSIKSLDKASKCKLALSMSFENPINPNRRKFIELKTINIQIDLQDLVFSL